MKFIFFLSTHTILLSNMINYNIYIYIYIYISIFEQNNFKISIILLVLFLKVFAYIFIIFRSILDLPIFCVKIFVDICLIYPIYQWKYGYICNY